MMMRAWSVLAISFAGICAHAGSPELQARQGVDGKVPPASQQDFFEPDSPPAPRLLPAAILELMPPKYAPPIAGLIEALGAGTIDLGFPVRIALALMKDIPIVKTADFTESREPPLAHIP